MGMLDRIKKKQLLGFKEFVQNMETTAGPKRVQIFMAGVLEDPIYMDWVMRNIRTFNDLLKLPSEEIEKVLLSQEQLLQLFAKSIQRENLDPLDLLPRLGGKLKDELSYLGQLTDQEIDSAKAHILKVTRKFQMDELIIGFDWKLPPQDVFFNKPKKDGTDKIYFDNGILAAEGDYLKAKRVGPWKHYYDSGKLLAEGEYLDGLKVGIWSFYFGNGELKSQGKYLHDQKHGLWKEWDRNGNLTEFKYREGVKVDS